LIEKLPEIKIRMLMIVLCTPRLEKLD